MSQPEIRIKPPKSLSFNFAEIWENRELLYFFTWRDIKVKYKQAYLGIFWSILQPLFLMLIFYFIFYRNFKITTETPYPVYVFSGLILWGLFSSGITHSSESLLSNAQIIRKIYFPRIIIPVSSLLTALIDFSIAFVLFLILIMLFRQPVNWQAVYSFPLAILLTFFSSLGLGLFLSALNVKYRDFRYALPFGMQVIFFTSQVVYSIHSIENHLFRSLLYINPLNGALELFNYGLQQKNFDQNGLIISVTAMIVYLLLGLVYFKKTEAFFADII